MLKIEEPEISFDFKHLSLKKRAEYIKVKGLIFRTDRTDKISRIQKYGIISYFDSGSASGSNFHGNDIIECDYKNMNYDYLNTLL